MVTSSAVTNSVNTVSILSKPATTFIISELGFVYFFGKTDARNAVMVYHINIFVWFQELAMLTSRACASAGALPALMCATALENNCLVCL